MVSALKVAERGWKELKRGETRQISGFNVSRHKKIVIVFPILTGLRGLLRKYVLGQAPLYPRNALDIVAFPALGILNILRMHQAA